METELRGRIQWLTECSKPKLWSTFWNPDDDELLPSEQCDHSFRFVNLNQRIPEISDQTEMAGTPWTPDLATTTSSPASLSSPATPSRRLLKRGDRMKMISQITILDGTMDGKIIVSLKIDDYPFVDDNSLALLAMPDGPFMMSEPIKPTFHPFVITVQNGQRIYGGSYIFGLKQIARSQDTDEHKVVYISRALVALTIRPLVDQLKRLLQWCVHEGGCNPRWLRCLTSIRLPQKGRFVLIHLPDLKNLGKGKNCADETTTGDLTSTIAHNLQQPVTIFRPLNSFPMFDYSFRLLSETVTIENLLLLFCCALNELQVLVVSDSYFNLMMVSECLIALLNPFKWQHVYVPILPSKLGLHYLDAPTPFIMGTNSRLRNFIKPNRIACYFDCDNKKLQLNVESSHFVIPPFIEDLRHELNYLFSSCLKSFNPTAVVANSSCEALKRVSEIAQKYNLVSDSFTSLDEVKLNHSVRTLFYQKLKKYVLNNYQHYILYASDPKEQVKFDAVSYLSDQPLSMRPFLQNFVETQMFASFIDEAGKKINNRQKPNDESNMADSFYLGEEEEDQLEDQCDYWQNLIEARYNNALNINLIELEELSSQSNSNTAVGTPFSPCKKRAQAIAPSVRSLASPSKQVPAAMAVTANWKVVETLLKEVKIKTKRILLAKMGSDEIGATMISPSVSAEDNTLITALCDLIERIWSHARADGLDHNSPHSNKCPFWSHVTAFFQVSQSETTGSLARTRSSQSFDPHIDFASQQESQSLGGWISIKKRIDSLSQLSLDHNGFLSQKDSSHTKSIPSTLSYDYKSICDMTDIKTEVGKSRAFIRLALERKLLSKHLRTLLYNQDILQSLYKRYAFLRSEEEREQFLTHLLTLNAVDLFCFTHTFTTSSLPYTLIICAGSFNGSVSIVGSANDTMGDVPVEGCHTTFKNKNFGHVYAMSLSVRPSQKVYVDQCFLRNDVTNTVFKFECKKWLGKNIDDGSTERLLIGELISGTINDHIKRSSHTRSSSIGQNWSRSSENTPKDDQYSVEDLQSLLGESINQIMKLYFSEKTRQITNSNDSNRSQKSLNNYHKSLANSSTLGKISRNKNSHNAVNMISLLFGPKKFLWVILQVFYYGFKNRRSFRKQTFIWDYLLRVQCDLKLTEARNSGEDGDYVQNFIRMIDRISNKTDTYGKDMKFQLFIFLSLREHQLSPHFLKLLLRPHLLQAHYEPQSFFRDPNLRTFLTQILNTFNEIDLKLEKDIVKS